MNKKLLLSAFLMFAITFGFSQTKEELEAQKAEKQAEVDKFQAEADAIQAQIDALPGWHFGAFGTVGGSLSQFSNWYAQGSPNNSAGNIGFTVNGYANKIEDAYFWKNALTLNLNWVKLDDEDDPNDDDSFRATTDVFNIFLMHHCIVFIQYNNCVREHSCEWSFDNLHTVVFTESSMPDSGQTNDALELMRGLESFVSKRQVIRHHQQCDVLGVRSE